MVVSMLVLTLGLTSLMATVTWAALHDGPHDDEVQPRSPAEPARVPADAPDAAGSLEGVLVVQLANGAISRRQYQHAMAFLAERDAARPPQTAPAPPDA